MSDLSRRDLALLLAGFGAAAASPALAQSYTVTLPPSDRARVKKAAEYLQGLKEAKARFTQTNDRGGQSAGALYLSRPGKARFEYDAAAGLLVVADGRSVNIFDKKLKTFDSYPLGATPLAIFLSRRIQLDNEVMVSRVQQDDSGFTLTVKNARNPTDGSLILSFAEEPMTLRGWTVIEENGSQTRVQLTDLEPASGLDPALFVLRAPATQPAQAPAGDKIRS